MVTHVFAAGEMVNLTGAPLRSYRLGWVIVRRTGEAVVEAGDEVRLDDIESTVDRFPLRVPSLNPALLRAGSNVRSIYFFVMSVTWPSGEVWNVDPATIARRLDVRSMTLSRGGAQKGLN
jgi:hypothetical protein